MQITIASGKGGTGKTLLATNISYVLKHELDKQVTYLDCDVEEPNGHLFLTPEISQKDQVTILGPVDIDQDKCTGCGICSQTCVFNAIAVMNRKAMLFPELCHSCGACTLACPENAIIEGQRNVGDLFYGQGKGLPMGYGVVHQGQGGMTPRMIKSVKQLPDSLTDTSDHKANDKLSSSTQTISLLDAPPGTACSAVEAVQDSDLVVLITDLTPFGLHDLKLSVGMTRTLGIEPVIVINRSGGEDPGVYDYCKKEQLQIVGEVPQDRKIAEIYSRGELIVEQDDQYKKLITNLSERLLNLAKNPLETNKTVSKPEEFTAASTIEKQQSIHENTAENAESELGNGTKTQDKKELVVISGKGGTGKTSLTASLTALAKDTVVADCDVDASDLPLILEPRVLEHGEFSGGYMAEIDEDKCIACGVCEQYCRFDAIHPIYNFDSALTSIQNFTQNTDGATRPVRYQVDEFACEGCGTCELACGYGAVSLHPAVNGEWFKSKIHYGSMAHARLGLAEENSGKLVTLTREKASELAAPTEISRLYLDGSPGTGCPVIASLTGTDFAVIVTEPTVSGLHDLERILELCRHFKVPGGIVINKADINDHMSQKILDYIYQLDVDFLGSLPYDENVISAQLKGESVVEFAPNSEISQEIKKIYGKIKEIDMVN